MKTMMQSNTIRVGVGQILAGAAGYLSGQMDEVAAGTLAVTGLIQIVQRLMSMKKEAAATTESQPGN